MTLSDVAALTLLTWDTVKSIVKEHLRRDYSRPALQGVRYLGIDEIHLGRKRKFYTVVIDLEDGRILGRFPVVERVFYEAFGGVCAWLRPGSGLSPRT